MNPEQKEALISVMEASLQLANFCVLYALMKPDDKRLILQDPEGDDAKLIGEREREILDLPSNVSISSTVAFTNFLLYYIDAHTDRTIPQVLEAFSMRVQSAIKELRGLSN